LVALLTSDAVEAAAQKNNLAFADLLAPFCATSISIKDPTGVQISTKLRIDLRDVQKSGYLLSLTVLPSVLHEAILSSETKEDEDIWTSAFRDTFMYWFEPSEVDFLKSYLCCIFVISADDANPLGELNRLTQLQHLQQHGSSATSSFGPAHCTAPKWFLPNILKFYVILQDVSLGNEQKANDAFASMCLTYGAQFCHLLKINSTTSSNMPDPWGRILKQRYRGLNSGLDLARRHLLAKTSEQEPLPEFAALNLDASLGTVAALGGKPSPVFTTSPSALSTISQTSHTNGYIPSDALTIRNGTNAMETKSAMYPDATVTHGECLDAEDRERLRVFIEEFIRKALVPFAERQVNSQNETLTNRRSIGKSFTSMRKWLTATSNTPSGAATTSYGPESSELQMRRLADMAFLFGMYTFANQLYQSIKKDFANDQSWLHNAAALEMAALTNYLSTENASPRKFPHHYMENALNHYLNTCGQPLLALRCVIISVEILSRMEMHAEAANQMLRLTANLPDLHSAVILEYAATFYQRANMARRRAFNLVLAGHRYGKTGQEKLALRCYEKAFPEYVNKKWAFAEDHFQFVLSKNAYNADFAIECSAKLLRPYGRQSGEQQSAFLAHYIQIIRSRGNDSIEFILPLVHSGSIRVIRGEEPEEFPSRSGLPSFPISDGNSTWTELEQAAFGALPNAASFHHLALTSDEQSDNTHIHTTPPNERFRVQLRRDNPLSTPLTLRRRRLSAVRDTEGTEESPTFSAVAEIEQLTLPPYESPESLSASEGYVRTVESSTSPASGTIISLSVTPTETTQNFVINRLLFDIVSPNGSDVISSYLPLRIPGKRLFATKQQRMSKVYAPDKRLQAHVPSTGWPRLSFIFTGNAAHQSHVNAYCSQLYQIAIQVNNTGHLPVSHLAMATNQPEYVSLSQPNDRQQWTLCEAYLPPQSEHLIVQSVKLDNPLDVGQSLSLRLSLRCPSLPVSALPILIVFYYTDISGGVRHFHHSISVTTQVLVSMNVQVMDDKDGLCILHLHNTLSTRDSVLAKCELLRYSAIVRTTESVPINVNIRPLLKNSVTVECAQKATACFYLTASTEDGTLADVWLGGRLEVPQWPYLIPASVFAPYMSGVDKNIKYAHMRLAVLWKATIANVNGTVATVLGENLLVNPFANVSNPSKAVTLPGTSCAWRFVLSEMEKSTMRDGMQTAKADYFQIPWSAQSNERQVLRSNDVDNIGCRILSQNESIIHNFSRNTPCKFRVRIEITNGNIGGRECIACVTLTNTTDSLFANMAVTRAVIPSGNAHMFTISFSTFYPGVFDVASYVEAYALFDGDQRVPLSLNSCNVVVEDIQSLSHA
jgi:hypothetical protein